MLKNRYSSLLALTPPGETIQDLLDERGLSQTDLAERLGLTKKTVNEIIKGKAPITSETALGLEKVFKVPAEFWTAREQNYRDALAREEERERLANRIDWLNTIPWQTMVNRQWVTKASSKVDQLIEGLHFFGVANPDQWQVHWSRVAAQYRRPDRFQTQFGALAAWMRKGELLAQEVNCNPYNESVFKDCLNMIKAWTTEPFEAATHKAKKACAGAGVALVVLKELKHAPVSGVSRWLTPDKALIQLSLRYKTDDQFWFTFFHEAGHLLLHSKKEVHIDTSDNLNQKAKEKEANDFAAGFLIDAALWSQALNCRRLSYDWICEFAERCGIAPGIVVGRLQREERLPYSHLNTLKRRIESDNLSDDAIIQEMD
jgi:HTH-type transcriptional regulator/antitoxin HigA